MTVSVSKLDPATPPPPAAPAGDQDSFVINLCSSTTPMALTQPQLAELKNYKFFMSRRLEDGRERFRLHMGYFESLLQAEDLLPVVREIYPGAWAGEAPGKRLRARAAAAVNSAPAAPPAPPAPVAPVAPVATVRSTPAAKAAAAGPSAEVLANMPTLSAAPTPAAPALKLELVAQPPRQMPPEPAAAPAIAAAPAPAPAPAPVVKVAAPAAAPAAAAPVPAPKPAPKPAPPPKAASRPAAPKSDANLPFDQRSNVREVLKSLDESARDAAAAAPKSVVAAPVAAAAPMVPAGPVVRQSGVLPDSQVMRLLEEKRGDPLNTTSTPAAFAVQLQWSVQPIDIARVPPLAIFGAYTLYTVEGSREGRRWYGLRLGFFSDANSAKQVAQYVRSEFSSVAVVPVSLKERDGASGTTGAIPVPATADARPAETRPTERLPDQSAEFKLWDDTGERPKLPGGVIKAAQARPAPATKAKTAGPAGKAPGAGRAGQKGAKSRGDRVHAHDKRAPKTLEETLEILGADELQIEGGRKLVSEGGIKHGDIKVTKNSAFTRLLDRLAERGR